MAMSSTMILNSLALAVRLSRTCNNHTHACRPQKDQTDCNEHRSSNC